MSCVQPLNTTPDRALFSGEIEGLIVAFFENERPLSALSGLMDWHFHGEISSYLRQGIIGGKLGQCAYLPIKRNDKLYHLILLGCGNSLSPGERIKPQAEAMQNLKQNLAKLNLKKVGISRSDFGNASDDFFETHLKGIPLWIVQ